MLIFKQSDRMLKIFYQSECLKIAHCKIYAHKSSKNWAVHDIYKFFHDIGSSSTLSYLKDHRFPDRIRYPTGPPLSWATDHLPGKWTGEGEGLTFLGNDTEDLSLDFFRQLFVLFSPALYQANSSLFLRANSFLFYSSFL